MKNRLRILTAALAACLFAGCCLAACNVHTHELTAVQEKTATCIEAGNLAYWYCEGCGKYFSDEAALQEIAEADTVTEPLGHVMQRVALADDEIASNGGREVWTCSRCGETFAEQSGETPVDVLAKMFTDREFYAEGTENGPDVFTSTQIGGKFAPIAQQKFVMRFFMGFTYDVSELVSGQNVEVHMNIHRTDANPNWWQLVFRYHPTAGQETVVIEASRIGAGGRTAYTLDRAFSDLIKEQNGLYLLLQRDGDRLACYAEDADGKPQLIFSVTGFSTGAIYQMRIAHFENYYADETHGGVIRDMTIALDTVDLSAERTEYGEPIGS